MEYIDHHHSIKYMPEEEPSQKGDYKPTKRQIIVKDSFVKSEEEVKVYVLLLSQYLSKLNEFRMEIDIEEVEEVIINDFIKMDSFIHKI